MLDFFFFFFFKKKKEVMDIVVLEYDGSGVISPSSVGEVFVSAWQPYVSQFASSAPSVSAMFASYIAQTASEFASVASFRRVYLSAPGALFFIAVSSSGELLGHVALRQHDSTSSQERHSNHDTNNSLSCELWRMAVLPSAQGRGVARALHLAVLRAAAQRRQCSLLWLTTGEVMTGARKLYDALGFKHVKTFNEPGVGMICRFEMAISEEMRVRHLWSIVVLRQQNGSEEAEVVVDSRVLDRGKRNDMLKLWFSKPHRCIYSKNRRKKVKIRKLKSSESVMGLRLAYSSAWLRHCDAWANVDPALAAAVKAYVTNALETDLVHPQSAYRRVWVAEDKYGAVAGFVAVTDDGELKRFGKKRKKEGEKKKKNHFFTCFYQDGCSSDDARKRNRSCTC